MQKHPPFKKSAMHLLGHNYLPLSSVSWIGPGDNAIGCFFLKKCLIMDNQSKFQFQFIYLARKKKYAQLFNILQKW